MAAADCSGWRRFAVACGVLSRRVRAEAAPGKIMAGAAHACPDATVEPPTMLLMPGADVAPDVRDEAPSTPAGGAAQAQAQLTIMYGGRVLVFDDVPADRAAELMRVAAAAQDVPGGLADMPVTRKASLQRFMEKRRDRHAGRAPYAKASTNGKEKGEAGWWLGLGIPGGWER